MKDNPWIQDKDNFMLNSPDLKRKSKEEASSENDKMKECEREVKGTNNETFV